MNLQGASIENVVRAHVQNVLLYTDTKGEAASILGVNHSTLNRMLKRLKHGLPVLGRRTKTHLREAA